MQNYFFNLKKENKKKIEENENIRQFQHKIDTLSFTFISLFILIKFSSLQLW